MEESKEFDLFVIGGGSGGLAAAKEAQKFGAKVGLADFVTPTPKGTKWGLGGTCVNVGCIPKKLMHFAALGGEMLNDQRACGWKIPEGVEHSWEDMVRKVNVHIRGLNWGYKTQLKKANIIYYNGFAKIEDANTITVVNGENIETIKAKNIVLACGARPNYPDIPGAKELGITSDDLFWLKKSPGKTCVVGGSYVALECAGFLANIGLDVTLLVRSIFLRGFDQQMAERVGEYIGKHGVKIQQGFVPLGLEKNEETGKIICTFGPTEDPQSTVYGDEFDTVLFAIGRIASTKDIGLENVGITMAPNGKVQVDESERTSCPSVYAIGDVVFGRPELTPVAAQTGVFLARRLFGGIQKLMNYDVISTCVFTPLEYGASGLSEDAAINKYGEDKLEVYHTSFKPLEWNMFPEHEDDMCYSKVIVLKETEKVIGFHILSPNAGEVTQGMGIGLSLGITKQQLDDVVGIHPTIAEEIVGLDKTKREFPNAKKTAC